MIVEYLGLALFLTACVFLLAGFPVAFTLAGTALGFAALGDALGILQIRELSFFPQRMFSIMTNEVVVAVPLFIYMGLMLERSRVAEDLLSSMARLFRGARGGLALSVVAVGALMAASTGIVGATVVTMGLLALPVMQKYGYDDRLATGTICASGTLGQVIPPSIVLVFLGDIMTYANQQANLKAGNFAGESVGVGDLFAGSLFPGLMLVGLYLLYILFHARLRPQSCPPIPPDEAHDALDGRARLSVIVKALVAPAVLIIAVLGSILGGVATPTEAAGVGAVGATLLAGLRLRPNLAPWMLAGVAAAAGLIALNTIFDLRLMRADAGSAATAGLWLSFVLVAAMTVALAVALSAVMRESVLTPVLFRTARITAMVFAILIGASLFSLTFRGLGGEEMVHGFLQSLPGGLTGAMIFVMALMFVMGFFLDFLEIIFIIVPIVGPTLILMGADPVWLGVMIAINLQTSFLTPPFGFALFFLRGVTPEGISTQAIYRGVIPFILLQLTGLALIAAFPAIGTWLPDYLFSR